ncbi:Carboxylesterase type B [Macrophomina phaseolina MS6]|uniref:Carboxylesterase type B n=1 Tax=Macrophomina phaseolina (strain MS6) TaxID=1126212 RepID=K2RPU0_MACPH|nr:Carboxylesterase type B [Macrophomina phaseolina MS6]
MYAGQGLVSVSANNVIYVASNYRVGAYGWLAGTTMERDGLPNAGLHDVRAALEWTQRYIGLLGGDAANVAAWGESAGAGCLLHLLTAGGGTVDPLFKRLVLQSPAFDFSWDRRGRLEDQTQQFLSDAGCAGQGVGCLRQVSSEALKAANDAGTMQPYSGRTAYQVAADGSFVRQLAALELASGNFWKGLDGVILSHVEDEALIFTDTNVTTPERFRAYLEYAFPTAGVPQAVEQQYWDYVVQTSRLHDVISGSRLVCNVRFAADALLTSGSTKVWNMQYAVPPGVHGTDLIPTFFLPDPPSSSLNSTGILNQGYQSYLVSLSRAGDPNTFRKRLGLPATIEWPDVDNAGEYFGDVLNVGTLGFSLTEDKQNSKPVCGFWKEVAAALTNLGGYAPPGAVVEQSLLPKTGDASTNYSSGQ